MQKKFQKKWKQKGAHYFNKNSNPLSILNETYKIMFKKDEKDCL